LGRGFSSRVTKHERFYTGESSLELQQASEIAARVGARLDFHRDAAPRPLADEVNFVRLLAPVK